jgi:DNA-binding NtrC family response regulator
MELFRRIERAAGNDANVLVTGETGVGKEIVSRTIHRMSPRAERPFTEQNCAALPEQLLESELFGYRKGTFTGATQDRRGLIEATAGGTLFLDEIGEASLPVQAKLLRFIETKTVRSLGDVTARRVDVRIVAATNRDLAADAAANRFRQDLYYRLNVLTIRLRPLRERRSDIPRLITCLVNCGAGRGEPLVIEDDALAALMAHDWPGNLRELHNAALHAIAMSGERRISLPDLPEHILGANPRQSARSRNAAGDVPPAAGSTDGAPRLRAGEITREWIESALARAEGNRSVAARLAGLSRSSFYYNLKKLGFE